MNDSDKDLIKQVVDDGEGGDYDAAIRLCSRFTEVCSELEALKRGSLTLDEIKRLATCDPDYPTLVRLSDIEYALEAKKEQG